LTMGRELPEKLRVYLCQKCNKMRCFRT